MAYTQKGNPFKQKPTTQETLAIRLEEIKSQQALETFLSGLFILNGVLLISNTLNYIQQIPPYSC